jgi:hypothetical protein
MLLEPPGQQNELVVLNGTGGEILSFLSELKFDIDFEMEEF